MQNELPRRTVLHQLGAGSLLSLSARLRAQDAPFPSKPIRIVPFGTAGGPIDTIARIYGAGVQGAWLWSPYQGQAIGYCLSMYP